MSSDSVTIRQYPSAARAWSAVFLFSAAALLSYTDRQILALLVAPVQHDLHLSDTGLSILQGAAFAVLYSVIGLPLGRIADLVPRRALLACAVVLWSLGTMLCGLAHSFGELFAARLLVGIGEAALAPAAMSLIGDYFRPAGRALPTGVFLTGMVIGGGAAFAIGGFLLNAAQQAAFASVPLIGSVAQWRQVLLVLGAAGALFAVLFLGVDEPVRRRLSAHEFRSMSLSFRELLATLRQRGHLLLPLYAAMGIGSIVDYAILTWTPALLSRRFAFTPAEIGAALGGVAIAAGVIGTPIGGWLADWTAARFGLLSRIRLCSAILLVGLIAAPVGVWGWASATMASVFVWITVSSMAGTIGIATTLDLLPSDLRGFGTATIAFGNTIIGLGLGPTLVALATDRLYGVPSAVGLALTTVSTPAILISCILLYVAAVAARREESAIGAGA